MAERLTEWAVYTSSLSWDSITIAHTIAFLEDERPQFFQNKHSSQEQMVLAVLRWVRENFSVKSAENSLQVFESPAELAQLLHTPPPRVATPLMIILLFHAILLSLGVRARMVYTLDPRKPIFSSDCKKEYIRRFDDCFSAVDGVDGTCTCIDINKNEGHRRVEYNEWPDKADIVTPVASWVEVRLSSNASDSLDKAAIMLPPQKWINIDPVRNIVGNKALVEQQCRQRNSSVAYVVAITSPAVLDLLNGMNSGNLAMDNHSRRCGVRDVTDCYATNPTRTRQKRLRERDSEIWWACYLNEFLCPRNDEMAHEGNFENLNNAVEDCILNVLPTSESAFLHHPRFVLKSHLSGEEVLPSDAKPVGVFSGLPIYRREDITEIRTKADWQQLNRTVREGEVPSYFRDHDGKVSFKEASYPHNRKSCGFLDKSTRENLYTHAQTDALPRPKLKDGKIPRNQYGNILVLNGDTSSVPVGASYVPHDLAANAARDLGMQHAEAVVGFKKRHAHGQIIKNIPIFQGVVVLEEDADLIEESARVIEARICQQKKEAAWKGILLKWQRLVQSLLLRDELRQSYGA